VGPAVRDGGDCQLYRVNTDGTEYREVFGPFTGITAGDRLSWTNDGRAILFVSREGASGECRVSSCLFKLMRVGADGGSPEFTGLEMNLGTTGVFSVSTDGSRIAFDTTLPGSDELVALDVSSLMKQR
jgi:Tol biopolymer transport system component